MVRSLPILFLALIVAACGGGSGGGGTADTALVEGVSTEFVPPEDAGGNLVPPAPIVIPPAGGGTPVADWTNWPESLAKNVLDANNLYSSSDQALSWPENGVGIYSSRADCAGYVTRSMMKAFGFTADDFKAWTGSTGPSSARYHDNIVAQNNFQRISVASQVRRGDILASKYIDKTSGGTGHTMIAAGPAVLRAAPTEPLVANTRQYELRIIDSTSSPHGATDTRKGTGVDGKDQDGAGLGTMRLYADEATGVIVGYTWSLSSGSKYYTATSPADDRRSLVVGRLTFAQ